MVDPQIFTPYGSGRSTDGDAKSPEFEFWMVRNPSFPQPKLLSADELFSDGVLLPLHKLCLSDDQPPPPQTDPKAPATATPPLSSSKRWMDIFRRKEKNCPEMSGNNAGDDRGCIEAHSSSREKKKQKRRSVSNASNGVTAAADFYINIWPFSRSRSAGNTGTQPRPKASNRRVSSAPCSRSNSTGESKSRKWPSSPGRQGGVHLGRSSPVWQVRRSGIAAAGGRNQSRRKMPFGVDGPKARVLSLNVPTYIGYHHYVNGKIDQSSSGNLAAATAVGGHGQCQGGVPVGGVGGSSLFNIRSFFTKKVC